MPLPFTDLQAEHLVSYTGGNAEQKISCSFPPPPLLIDFLHLLSNFWSQHSTLSVAVVSPPAAKISILTCLQCAIKRLQKRSGKFSEEDKAAFEEEVLVMRYRACSRVSAAVS
jgi:hypothetical protein